MVHNNSLPPGQFGGPYIEQPFTNCLDPDEHPYFAEIKHLHVSAHALIRRDGSIIQFVPYHHRAWHVGQSNWCGRERCNDYSIGIELEGSDDCPFEAVQYARLADMIRALQVCYPTINNNAITGHSDIAPERKTDPGPYFSSATLLQLLSNQPGGTMALICIILALLIEGSQVSVDHLRESHWFDAYSQRMMRHLPGVDKQGAAAIIILLLPILIPLAILQFALSGEFYDLFSFAFALLVLIYTLGGNLDRDIKQYLHARETGLDILAQ